MSSVKPRSLSIPQSEFSVPLYENASVNVRARHTFITLADFLKSLHPNVFQGNVRFSKHSYPVKDMIETLRTQPKCFPLMNLGVHYVGSTMKKEGDRYHILADVSKGDKSVEGIVNGQHTARAIVYYALELIDVHLPSKLTTEEFMEAFESHRDALLAYIAKTPNNPLSTARIAITIMSPMTQDTRGMKDFSLVMGDIIAALNSSSPVKDSSLNNYIGLYNPLKESLSPTLEQLFSWKEGEPGRVDVADLIRLQMVLLHVNKFWDESPNILYNGRAKMIDIFVEIVKANSNPQKEARVIELNSSRLFSSCFKSNEDMMKLYDHLYSKFPDYWKSARGHSIGKKKCEHVIALSKSITATFGLSTVNDYKFPVHSWILPLFYVVVAKFQENGKYEFDASQVDAFLSKKSVFEEYIYEMEEYDMEPNSFGKRARYSQLVKLMK